MGGVDDKKTGGVGEIDEKNRRSGSLAENKHAPLFIRNTEIEILVAW
jgi:hypothetical protein